MSLLAELKKKLNAVYDRIDSLKAESDALDDEAYDLDVACRALEEDELYATKDLDEPLEPAEALLDHQPEAASPEFASEQGEAIEHMIATSDAVCEELSEAYTQDSEPSPQPEPLVPLAETVLQALPGGVEESRDQSDERIEVASEPLATTEQTLITDDIPSIPREEIPIGAAVETYTDSGIETVKISGTTYVVDDEPVAEASYAPINSEPASDALMWANGFEADAKSKAEPEQDKRPFWMFGKKELA